MVEIWWAIGGVYPILVVGQQAGSVEGMRMNLDNPSVMLSGVLIAAVGAGFFIYGRKQGDLLALLFGIVLSVLPFFAHTMLVMWGLTGLSSAGMYALRKLG